MTEKWRLLDTGALSAAQNMALEKVLLTSCSQGWVPNTLHFLQFSPHCALVGYHQAVELEVEEDYCRQHGIDINRRISGGGAIYMDEGQLGWELYARRATARLPRRMEEMYRLLCQGAIAGLRRLGVAANFRPQNDIEVNGRKISGSGGTEFASTLLYHGTILTDFAVETMLRCLKLPIKKLADKEVQSFKERVVCLRELLGVLPPLEDIKAALTAGFAAELGIELEPGELTAREEELLAQELPLFQSETWIRGHRAHFQASSQEVADYKASGGLIRVCVRLDGKRRLIKQVFITGDFFAYPARSIMDLEATLKNTASAPSALRQTVRRFFAAHRVVIPGIGADDFYHAICAAVTRAAQAEEMPVSSGGAVGHN